MTAEMLSGINITKRFGDRTLLDEVTVQVAAGEILCVMGPSGAGKSTLLRIIAGLEKADLATVRVGGNDVTALAPHRRGIGFVFQDLALFPHLDVAGNIGFGLRMHRTPRAQRAQRIRELLELVDLPGIETRSIETLSGGEQQRVALARALAADPVALLLDEPFGALDSALKERLGSELRRIVAATGIAALHVTHDPQEASEVGDRIFRLPSLGPVPPAPTH